MAGIAWGSPARRRAMPLKVLVTGANGQLGRELMDRAGPAGFAPVGLGHGELDIADRAAVERAVANVDPDLVVNAAAYTAVDQAESEPERAYAINAEGPRHLARACAAAKVPLIHVSTDYVFDGAQARPYREDDPARPLSVYGESKRAGERHVLESGAEALVVRTSGVLGRGGSAQKGGSFVDRILAQARAGKPLRVVADQRFSPTAASDLAGALLALVGLRARGVVHVTNEGSCS